MQYTVKIKPQNHELLVSENETILEAAMRESCAIPYACCNAICSTCRCKMLEGTVHYDEDLEIYGLTPEEMKAGYILACSAKPRSNLILFLE